VQYTNHSLAEKHPLGAALLHASQAQIVLRKLRGELRDRRLADRVGELVDVLEMVRQVLTDMAGASA